MNRLIAIALLLLGSLLTIPLATHPAYGAALTGVVCIAPTTSTRCPAPYTVGNVSVGSSFLVGVFISNSQPMGGFDIYVSVNPTYLHPNSAVLGPLIANPSTTSICVNNVSQTGACTTKSANGNGVVEVTTSEGTGLNECGGIGPCSGMAFTINYTVVANTANTPIYYPTFTPPPPAVSPCANTSVSSPPNMCVLVADNNGAALPETVQTGAFTSLNPTANFFANPTTGPAPLNVAFDASISAPTHTHTINNYTWTFGDGNVTKLTGPTPPRTVSHIYYAVGIYKPNLQTTDNSGAVSTITDTLTITVQEDNFSITALPASQVIRTGANKNFSITLNSINNTGGTVNLSNNGTSSALGIAANWTSTPLILPPGGTRSVGLRISVSSSAPSGSFNITITGSFTYNASKTSQTTLRHSTLIRIQVAGFNYMLLNTGDIYVPRGSSNSTKIQLILVGTAPGQPVTLSLTNTQLPAGATASFSPQTLTPTTAGVASTLTISTMLSTPDTVGGITITVTGTPLGATTNNTKFTLSVTDFTMSASPSTVSIPQGGNGNVNVNPSGGAGFAANINLTAKPLSNNIVAVINATSEASPPPPQRFQAELYIIVKQATAPGNYTVTVTGSVGPLIHSFNVTVTVPTPDFRVTSAPTAISITAGASGTTIITLIGLNGFTGNIALLTNSSTVLGLSPSLSPTSVTITSGPAGSTLTISTLATTPPRIYAINITATSGGIHRSTIVTVTVTSPQSSVSLAAASLSAQSVTAGKSLDMTITVSNAGTTPVNITITMDVSNGGGSNITVAQKTVTLSPGQAAQTFTLSWNTTQWSGGNYHVYARTIGSQTSTVNQAQSAGTVELSSPPSSPGPANLSLLPWATTGIASAVAVLFGLLLLRHRRPTGAKEST